MKKNIAYIVNNLNVNGISSVILSYCENLDKEKYNICIFSGNPISSINKEILTKENIKIIETPSKRENNALKYYMFLKRYLKGFDIVHINGNSRTITLELLISKMNKNKTNVAHCHSTSCDFKLLHYIFKPLFSHIYDYGIACSEQAGRWMFGNKKYKVLPNGIEIKKYIFDETVRKKIRQELNIEDNISLIGHVGNFSDVKNYPFIIKVFDEICEENNNFKLLLIGKYQNNPKLENYIRTSKNSDKIILLGTTNKISEYYNAMDCFVFPSKYEGLGIVAIEAQLNGLNCYVSNKVPSEVKITNNLVYLTIEEDNSKKWVKKIIENNNKKNNRRNSSNFKNSKYDIKNTISELEKIYN